MDWSDFPGHNVVLETRRMLLRPFQVADFELALRYYADPEFREMMEGDSEQEVSVEYLRQAGLYMASAGWLFALDLKCGRRTIGEACVQRMNLSREVVNPDEDVYRMPIGIWDKSLWGQGLGGEAVDILLEFAFVDLNADRVCAMDVKIGNQRSWRLFVSRGFRVSRELKENGVVDLELRRADYGRPAGESS